MNRNFPAMKKELFALLMLAVLCMGAVINLLRLDTLTESLRMLADMAESAADAGEYETARQYMGNAIALWQSSDGYTHVFISHGETDTAADCFFECASVLCRECEGEERRAAFDKLRYHLDSISGMEHVTLKSVF